MSRRTSSLIALACLGAAALPASAEARSTYYTQFDVSVQGKIDERWSRDTTFSDASYRCDAREVRQGSASIRFATRGKYRVTAGAYTGFHGRPLVDVNVDRTGTYQTYDEAGNPVDCGEAQPPLDGSACGQRSFASRLQLPKTSRFGLQLRGDRFQYEPDCPRPPAPPHLGEDRFHESTSVLGLNPTRVNWIKRMLGFRKVGRRFIPPKRVNVFRFRDRVVYPYGRPEWGEAVKGEYVADIEWTATVTRVGKLRG
jgi:hypothetical protein